MPFSKRIKKGKNRGKYRSKRSGKIYTQKQVKAYYATGGWKRPVKKRRRRKR
jgi:hypothetical protein